MASVLNSMKIRRSLLWFAGIVILGTIMAIRLARHPIKSSVDAGSKSEAKNNSTAEPAQRNVPNSSEANPTAETTSQVVRSTNTAPPSKEQQMFEILATQNDVPIIFYGKLEDQFGNPVAGAEITGNKIVRNGLTEGVGRSITTSDSKGLFKLDVGNGESLGVGPHKDGYVVASPVTEYKYSHLYQGYHIPDPDNPTVIRMWKLQGAEELVRIDNEYKMSYTGAPISFDFVAGKICEKEGDLEVIVTRSAGSLSKRNPEDWSIELKTDNGGVIEVDDGVASMTFQAPAEGYRPNYILEMDLQSPAWFDNIHKSFFLKSRGGQVYSKFHLDFRINNEPSGMMWFRFTGIANTHNSRNWEEESKKIKVPSNS
jgi:hypothetical protein